MLARSSLVVLVLLPAGCLKDLTQIDTGSGGVVTETSTDTLDPTETSTETATTDDKPACGNGKLEPGEQCDDGNATPGDGCEVDCTKTPGEKCGDGVVDEDEECDDGNDVAMDGCENNCTETVIPASCGDGKMDAGEECDDGNDDATDACTNTCKNAVCGDGVVLAGTEECDDGNAVETDACLSTCKNAICGDGQIQDGVEACDNGGDNNDEAYDGCTTQCQFGPRCGDSEVQAPQEECDDGSPDGDDLCNACKNTPRRYIFVTTATFAGKFNGVNGADARCGTAALDADLGGPAADWVAWLSDDMNNVTGRMDTTYEGWYALPGDPALPIAKGWAGLTSGTLLNPINKTETGSTLPQGDLAWSNTKLNGAVLDAEHHCQNWSKNTGPDAGRVGDPHATDSQWTDKAAPNTMTCNTTLHLYCVEN